MVLLIVFFGCQNDRQVVPDTDWSTYASEVCPVSAEEMEPAPSGAGDFPILEGVVFRTEGSRLGQAMASTAEFMSISNLEEQHFWLDESSLADGGRDLFPFGMEVPEDALIDFIACDYSTWSGSAEVQVQVDGGAPRLLSGTFEVEPSGGFHSLWLVVTLWGADGQPLLVMEFMEGEPDSAVIGPFDDGDGLWEPTSP